MNAKVKQHSLSFLVFLAISAMLWLLIKLSKVYTSQTTYLVQLREAPADQWVTPVSQTVKLSFSAKGFRILQHGFLREQQRVVNISLLDVPYHHETGNTYSISSKYVAQGIAERIHVEVTDITMNDAALFFDMETLKAKVVPVTLREDIRLQRQHERFGSPVIKPSHITLYGTEALLSKITSVETALLFKENVNQSFTQVVSLNLPDGAIRCDVDQVEVSIDVETITEKEIEVPIASVAGLDIRFLPAVVKVKCLVSIKDYASVTSASFEATVSSDDIANRKAVLPVTLKTPARVRVVSTNPDCVEYIIINKEKG